MDYSHWMKDTWDTIKTRKPWQILLPGTHNSGVYSAWNTIWVRNQALNIGAQLKGGIRWFDLRVTKSPPPVLTFHHSGCFPPPPDQSVPTAFEQIHDFAQANDHEILVLNLSAGFGSSLRGDDVSELRDSAIDWFKEWLVPTDFTPDYSLQNMIAAGKRIIVLSGLEPHPDPQKAKLLWDNRNNQFVQSTWDDYQSGEKHSFDDKLAWLHDRVSTSLRNRAQTMDSKFFCAEYMIYDYNGGIPWGTTCASKVNSDLVTWLDTWSQDRSLNFAMNVFTVDFFEQGADVVGKIVGLNQNLPPIPLMASAPKQPIPPAQGHLTRRELPHFRGDDSFSEQCAKKTLADLGLNYDKYKQEYLATGVLGKDLMMELSTKIPPSMISEYLKWFQAVGNKQKTSA